ncbi:ATP-binding protein [Streptomyces sp. TLI_146]|uniref:ATP-binding protein n=1 Tax=Streptomyces sp. TLI_146 TaxID=1938858 RepID=UPI000C70BFF5|nr:ATP-binding protein [Streptomyces sp. TLI_146]PKV84146.1 histidine kinase-like protein [Streptomyces sp. TLI_146]
MISQSSRHCTVELQALPSRIGQVRRIVSAQLRYWHLDPLIDEAALGVTELLTNVHRHAQPDKLCTVEIELLRDRLTVSVHDHDPRMPTVRSADPFATHGRGLAMIAAVSESWGVRPLGASGKTVWFTLPAPPSAVALPTRPAYGTKPAAAQPIGPCLHKRPALVRAEGRGGHPRTPARLPAVG